MNSFATLMMMGAPWPWSYAILIAAVLLLYRRVLFDFMERKFPIFLNSKVANLSWITCSPELAHFTAAADWR